MQEVAATRSWNDSLTLETAFDVKDSSLHGGRLESGRAPAAFQHNF